MTNKLRIAFTNVNLEIVAKILNPVARKYGCYVRYLSRENRLWFVGDQIYFRPIVEEMMASFFAAPGMAPARDDPRPEDRR